MCNFPSFWALCLRYSIAGSPLPFCIWSLSQCVVQCFFFFLLHTKNQVVFFFLLLFLCFLLSYDLWGGSVISVSIQETAVGSQSPSEELIPLPPPTTRSLAVSGVNYLCLFHIRVLFNYIYVYKHQTLRCLKSPLLTQTHVNACTAEWPSLLFLTLLLCAWDPKGCIK